MMLSKREAIDDTAEIGGSDTKISINDTKIGTRGWSPKFETAKLQFYDHF